MLASAAAEVPASDDWVVEPKWDGFRTLVEVDERLAVKVTSRHGRRWERALPEVAALGPLIGRPAVLDGETIVLADGRPHFGHLSRRLARARWAHDEARRAPATFVAFDILRLGDEDLTTQPWDRWRRALEGLHLAGPAIHHHGDR